MATKEARTADRFYGQDDSRRDPKFPSTTSASSSKSKSDFCQNSTGFGPDSSSPVHVFTSIPPADIKWWLKPSSGNQMHEWLNALESELDSLSARVVNRAAVINDNLQEKGKPCPQPWKETDPNYYVNEPWNISATCIDSDQDAVMQELKAVLNDDLKNITRKKDSQDKSWCLDDHFVDVTAVSSIVSEKQEKLSSDLESHWTAVDKDEPWWRSAGKDDLASFVAQKSLENIENCDLPRPHANHHRKGLRSCVEYSDQDKILTFSTDPVAEMGLSSVDSYAWESRTTGSVVEKQQILGNTSLFPQQSEPTLSNNRYSKTDKEGESQSVPDADPSKAQLLEALCHSQTRAREAEKAAQQAYTEKEHIVTLFVRQASQLFAYKQWFRLLQLQNICLQLKNKNQPINNLFPAAFPWAPRRGRPLNKPQHRAGKRKRNKPRYEIGKCAVAFAVGLGLGGAGLLLGWTMGWLFPSG